MPTPADQLDEIITSTLNRIEKSGKVEDQIFSGDPIFAFLNAKGKKEHVAGGKKIQVNLRHSKPTSNGKSYSGLDSLTAAETETIGHALFDWRQYAQGIKMSMRDMLINSSKEAIVDLWADKTQEAVDTLQDTMTVDLYGDGTGNSGKDVLGLEAIVSATGTLGGIDRSSETWWQAKVVDASASPEITVAMIRNMINTLRGPSGDPRKTGRVDLIVMPQDLFEAWEELYETKVQFRSDDLTLGKLGFEALRYKGAEITWSDNNPTGTIYFLSSEYLGLRVHTQRDFKFSGVMDCLVNDEDGKKSYLLWMGNLVASNCRRLGKLESVEVPA